METPALSRHEKTKKKLQARKNILLLVFLNMNLTHYHDVEIQKVIILERHQPLTFKGVKKSILLISCGCSLLRVKSFFSYILSGKEEKPQNGKPDTFEKRNAIS